MNSQNEKDKLGSNNSFIYFVFHLNFYLWISKFSRNDLVKDCHGFLNIHNPDSSYIFIYYFDDTKDIEERVISFVYKKKSI